MPEKIEFEVNVEKKQVIYMDHKDIIEGTFYIFPKCDTFYCVNCAKVLRDKGEKCWVCDKEINLE